MNCWRNHTESRVLAGILSGLGVDASPTADAGTLANRVHAYDGPPAVVILDEVDQLADARVLYEVYDSPNMSMILIANREAEFFVGLESRVQSRLVGMKRIEFEKYGLEELVSILRARVR